MYPPNASICRPTRSGYGMCGGGNVGQRRIRAGATGQKTPDKIPYVQHWPGGQGVSAQHTNLPFVKDKIPMVDHKGGGQGVNAQRGNLPQVPDQTPKMYDRPGGSGVSAQRTPDQRPYAGVTGGGQGVSAQRLNTPDKMPQVYDRPGGHLLSAQSKTRPDLVSWFRAIQERLKGVIVLNRSWESALTPTLLMHTPTAPKPPRWHPARPAVPDRRPAIGVIRQRRRPAAAATWQRRPTRGHWKTVIGSALPTAATRGIFRCPTGGRLSRRHSAA